MTSGEKNIFTTTWAIRFDFYIRHLTVDAASLKAALDAAEAVQWFRELADPNLPEMDDDTRSMISTVLYAE